LICVQGRSFFHVRAKAEPSTFWVLLPGQSHKRHAAQLRQGAIPTELWALVLAKKRGISDPPKTKAD